MADVAFGSPCSLANLFMDIYIGFTFFIVLSVTSIASIHTSVEHAYRFHTNKGALFILETAYLLMFSILA